MKLIIGLGNIGRQYKDTPHNAGFEFLNKFRTTVQDKGYIVSEWKNEKMFEADICNVKLGLEDIAVLFKPTTFMNLSGRAVSKIISKYEFDEIVLVHDDLDIKLGEYKIQKGKGPKDHNGVNSVAQINGSQDYLRVRIGVEARDGNIKIPGDIYVVRKFNSYDIASLNEVIDKAAGELFDLLFNV